MAKMIKCPTCQTAIEVPAQLTGQIVKCPGCGKGLKLVAKKPAGQPPAAAPRQSSGGSLAGQSMSGSVSAMTFTGEPPPLDDLPSLDSNCVVCGRPTDPELLVEDNGRMVCPDCIRGARSRIDRPTGGAEMVGFKAPMPAPVKRGSLISISPSFLIGAVAALVLIGCQIYLSMYEKPVGTLTRPAQASLVKQPGTGDIFVDSSAATQPTESGSTEATAAPAPTATQPSPSPTEVAAVPPPAPTPDAATQPAGPDTIFNDQPVPPQPVQPAEPQPPVPPIAPPPIPPGAIAIASNDPLQQGIEKLQAHDYAGAQKAFDEARKKYVLRQMGDRLTSEQQMTLVGLAAAYLGQNNPVAAKAQLDIVLGTPNTPGKGQKTRSAVLNNAILVLSKRTSPREMGEAIRMLREYLNMHQGDEYAANIFGTLIDRASTLATLTAEEKTKLLEQVDALDRYNDQMSGNHPGQLKWGTEWLEANLVRQYRANRGKPANAAAAAPEQLKRDIEAAQARVFQMQQAVNTAKQTGGDVVGAENQLNAAHATLGRLQMELAQAGAPPRPPTWLAKFDPVVPEAVLMPGMAR